MAATLNSAGIVYSDGTITYSAGAGGVGSYALCYSDTNAPTSAGGTIAGSSIKYSSVYPVVSYGGPGGSWRCMGRTQGNTGDGYGVTLWVRYA